MKDEPKPIATLKKLIDSITNDKSKGDKVLVGKNQISGSMIADYSYVWIKV